MDATEALAEVRVVELFQYLRGIEIGVGVGKAPRDPLGRQQHLAVGARDRAVPDVDPPAIKAEAQILKAILTLWPAYTHEGQSVTGAPKSRNPAPSDC